MADAMEALTKWVEEAIDLRFGDAGDPEGKIVLPKLEAGHRALADSLGRVRVRIDRLDEIRAQVTRVKAHIQRSQMEAKFAAEMAYHAASRKNQNNRVASFVSADERKADASLDSFAEKRAAHLAELRMAQVDEAVRIVDQCFWGLGNLREDHNTLLRTISFINSLEQQTG